MKEDLFIPFSDSAAVAAEVPLSSNVSDEVLENNKATDTLDNVNSPLWIQNGWSLTWPIWHLLPLSERRKLAHDHGYKTIGEFEEYMSLHQAMDDSELYKPYENSSIYPADWTKKATNAAKEPSDLTSSLKDQEENDDDSDSDEKMITVKQGSSVSDDLSFDELIEAGGKILMLHDEILHQLFSWLPVDAYATLALVSPHWKHFTRSEAAYKRLCERLYLNQSKRRQLHVSRFGGSYRMMLEQRPRVRAAGGCYVLKYAQIKQIQRDMWTEVPVGAILETVYYRYLYFQEDGRVLYALTCTPPYEMFRRLLKVCLNKQADQTAVWGTYQVQKDMLTVTAQQEWHSIRFELTIETNSSWGRFAALTLNRHFSSVSGRFDDWSDDRVEYNVPLECFRFVRSSFL